ncbi:MAG TPA: hypothetical protein VLZ89_06510 [Anaerolineales bacterium]|nr:hypothetical protein [Anaerolineales bacterium]
MDGCSHGEGFLALFQACFAPDGLNLLDEPAAALSPGRQLTFVSALKRMIEEDTQFISAAHPPIILAFPAARISSFDGRRIPEVKYDQLEHVNPTRDFLDQPQSFLRRL